MMVYFFHESFPYKPWIQVFSDKKEIAVDASKTKQVTQKQPI